MQTACLGEEEEKMLNGNTLSLANRGKKGGLIFGRNEEKEGRKFTKIL